MAWQVLVTFLEIVKWLILVRVLAGWLVPPGARNPLVDTLRNATDPILKPLAAVVPRIGGFDLSPAVAVLGIAVIQQVLLSVLRG